jgi:glycerol-3-phosphate acyltransferase PlsY
MLYLALPLCGYLAGSVSAAIIVSKIFGHGDPRDVGSGNPGATNVLRHGGKLAAVLTLLGDMLKGFLPVFIAGLVTQEPSILALVGLAAFLGHLYPVFFGFRGGKGVATALGVFLGIEPLIFAGMILVWLLMAVIFRYSSLAALTAALCAIPMSVVFTQDQAYVGVTFAIVALLFLRHRTNISQLTHGTEDKISFSHNEETQGTSDASK